jgi:hypothetical protein
VLYVLFRARAEDFSCKFWSKKYQIFSAANFSNLIIKTLDDQDWIWIGIQHKMLDPCPESMNPDLKHRFQGLDPDPSLSSERFSELDWTRIQFSQAGQSGSQTDKKNEEILIYEALLTD